MLLRCGDAAELERGDFAGGDGAVDCAVGTLSALVRFTDEGPALPVEQLAGFWQERRVSPESPPLPAPGEDPFGGTFLHRLADRFRRSVSGSGEGDAAESAVDRQKGDCGDEKVFRPEESGAVVGGEAEGISDGPRPEACFVEEGGDVGSGGIGDDIPAVFDGEESGGVDPQRRVAVTGDSHGISPLNWLFLKGKMSNPAGKSPEPAAGISIRSALRFHRSSCVSGTWRSRSRSSPETAPDSPSGTPGRGKTPPGRST